jgi:hypothetical protein
MVSKEHIIGDVKYTYQLTPACDEFILTIRLSDIRSNNWGIIEAFWCKDNIITWTKGGIKQLQLTESLKLYFEQMVKMKAFW